jgi:hypothetical protein
MALDIIGRPGGKAAAKRAKHGMASWTKALRLWGNGAVG